MNNLEDELDFHPDNNTVHRRMDISFHQCREQREKYDVKIELGKPERLGEFMKTLDVDFHKFNIIERRSLNMNDYVYIYNVSLKTDVPTKTNLKWTLHKRKSEWEKFEKKLNHELTHEGKMEKESIPQIDTYYQELKRNDKRNFDPKAYASATLTYILTLLDSPEIRAKSNNLYEFLEISLMPLPNGPMKYKEGPLEKKGGGRFKRNKVSLYCRNMFSHWQKRWFILTEEGIIYSVSHNSTKAREMLLFDQSFEIHYGNDASHGGISLMLPNRELNLKADNVFELMLWVDQIRRASKACPYTKKNRFGSFAPVREPNNWSKFYIDGEGYFKDLYNALMSAKKEVFITDWWLTPEIALQRPVKDDESEFRLDKVLGKVANTGVKVFVIVYHEVTMLMYNDSEHVKMTLESLSPNITVLKHPSEPFFSWSHHEKMVVIDQKVGFMGGIDLCFGRMDNSEHPLNDPAADKGEGHTFLGKDFSNPRIADFKNVREANTPQIDKKNTPRLPWHDAQIQVRGAIVADMARHFIQYWNHVEVDCYNKQEGSEAPLPKHNLIPGDDVNPLDSQNATIKLRNAFKKVIGQRQVIEAMKSSQGLEAETGKPNATMREAVKAFGKGGSKDSLKDMASQSTMASVDNVHKRFERHEDPVNKGNLETNRDVQRHAESRTSLDEKMKERDSDEEDKDDEEHNQLKKKDPSQVENPVDRQGGTGEYEDPDHRDASWPVRMAYMGKNVSAGVGRWFLNLVGYFPSKEEINVAPVFGEGVKGLAHLGHDQRQMLKRKYTGMFEEGGQGGHHKKGIRESIHRKSEKNKPKNWHFFADDDSDTDTTTTRSTYFECNKQQLFSTRPEKLLEGTVQCQMLRSASKWSIGLDNTNDYKECSIQNAYVELINGSKNFIYIENQFFMSVTAGKVLKNQVGQALVDRIIRAHEEGQKFRVMVFVPLLHSFEGEVDDPKAAVIRIQMHWQYATISRGGSSICESLVKAGINPDDYIQFYSLRAHARMVEGNPSTEEIYIHSKVMIVDDNIVLIGSANINDRSLEGDRDSELAMVLEDSKKIPSKMNGRDVEASEFACTFRRSVLAEHLGLKPEEVIDPLDDNFLKMMNETAETNTSIYREVFKCYPDDNIKKLEEIQPFKEKQNLEKYDELAPKIKGHIVWYPKDFLCEEKLSATLSSVEYYIPDETYV